MQVYDQNRILIREHETISIGPVWDSDSRTISEQQAHILDQYQKRLGSNLFVIGLDEIKSTNWVGSLGIGKYCIDVVPKIDRPNDPDGLCGAMENLLHMVATARLVPVLPAHIASLAYSEKPLIVALMELYVRNLFREWTRGPIRRYVGIEDNRPYLRGKLLFDQQIQKNAFHKERFYTISDEFISDNKYTQLLKAALRVCERQRFSNEVTRRSQQLIALFDDVQDASVDLEDLRKLTVDRSFKRFEYLFNLAKLLVSKSSGERSTAGQAVYSLMYDMNIVFERFIVEELKQANDDPSISIESQMAREHLLFRNEKPEFLLKPDIGVFKNHCLKCLIDTKWKELDRNKPHVGIAQSDMYQMYAYGKEYDVPMVILLYPNNPKLAREPASEPIAEYHHALALESSKTIRACRVDVSEPLGEPFYRESFRNTILRLWQ